MKTDLVTYLSDAISRIEAGGVTSPSGSWLAGMFGKGANLFEKEVSQFVAGLLRDLRLSYPEDVGAVVKGSPPYDKLTLGQLAAVIREAGNRQPRPVAAYIPGGRIPRFLDEILKGSPHLLKRMDDRRFTEIDLRRMLARASYTARIPSRAAG